MTTVVPASSTRTSDSVNRELRYVASPTETNTPFIMWQCDISDDPPSLAEIWPLLGWYEREIMDLLAQGLTGEQVAERLVLSPDTVKTHIRNAMTKLEAHTRVHAIAIAL